MVELLQIHPQDPQKRLISQVVDVLLDGGVIAYPTDSAYALGCRMGDKDAMERIRYIRKLDKSHNFTLICRDLSEIANYAMVTNQVYRLLKAATPGPYTFILPATKEVPRRLQNPKRKTIGLRIPDNAVVQSLLEELGEPLMSVTLILADTSQPVAAVEEVYASIASQVDIVVDAGICSSEPTTVIDCTSAEPRIIRVGRGDPNII